MKKFLKVAAAALAMVMTLGLAGCSGGDKTASSKESSSSKTTSSQSSSKTTSSKQEDKFSVQSAKPADAQNPVVTITMQNGGVIKAELYPDIAPNTVNNFISLINQKFYDGLTFHRIMDGFMIQGGDPKGNGTGGPGYYIPGEFSRNGYTKNDLKHTRGVLSMARSSMPDSAGSQFFIMHADYPSLDGNYAAFGKVTEGIEVVDQIVANAQVIDGDGKVSNPPVIATITVDTFGVTYPEPVKTE